MPNLHSSSPLTLTESHLSVEAALATAPLAPAAALTASSSHTASGARSRGSSVTLDGGDSNDGPRSISDKERDVVELSTEKEEDLEKGMVGPASQEDRHKALAADGSEVIIIDWQGEDDPAFPKNWPRRTRMAATLIVAAFTFLSFLAGLGGSAPLAIGAGVLGDVWRAEERGRAAALYSIGPLLGPALGPLCGGWVAQRLPNDGYKWVFFSTTIACAIIQVLGLLFLKETYAPVLLRRQALAMKVEMGLPKDSDRVQTVFEIKGGNKSLGHVLSHGLVRPFQMFTKESIIQIMSVYMAIIYGIIYITTVSTTDIFINIYHESVGVAGTNFVAQGLGFIIWAQVQGRLMDWVYRKLKERNGGMGRPEFRLPLMIPASLFLPLGLLLYG
ncbi:hypothetical protein P7C70_g4862, partial [Phenoliferia sp. Uapishka_3]